MRDTRLTLEQEQTLRNFLSECEMVGILLPENFKYTFYNWMGYKIGPDGVRVHKDVPLALPFHADAKTFYKDTYDEDWQKVLDAQTAAHSSSGEQAEGN